MAKAARDAVLITRPEPGAAATAPLVAARGYRPILAPCLVFRRLGRLTPDVFAGAQGVILTSAAAARAVAEDVSSPPPGLVAHCVGANTSKAAREAGFRTVETGAGDAERLLAALTTLDPARGKLVLLRGREAAFPLASRLNEAGFAISETVVYGADMAEALPEAAREAVEAGRAAASLFLSARTAAAFLALLGRAGLRDRLGDVVALCNSARTAAQLVEAAAFRSVEIAKDPTLESTLALLP